MNKKLIRLTESDLHRIVKESVNEISNKLLSNALDYSENHYLDACQTVDKKFNDLCYYFETLTHRDDNGIGNYKENEEIYKIYQELCNLKNRYEKFFERKTSQFSNFQGEYINRGRPEW